MSNIKSKIIMLIYNNNDMKSMSRTERQFTYLINDLTSRGGQLEYVNKHTAKMNDGTMIYKIPFGRQSKGIRITDLYIDESVSNLENFDKYIENVLLPMVLEENKYINLEVNGSRKDRVKIFNEKEVRNYYSK